MFNSVDHALHYAYRVSRTDIIDMSHAIADLRSSGIQLPRAWGSMSAHDHHAEAASILKYVAMLEPMQKILLDGYYDRALRWPALDPLAGFVGYDRIGLFPMRELISGYLGEKVRDDGSQISTRNLAHDYGGTRMMYHRERSRIKNELNGLWQDAMDKLDMYLAPKMNLRAA